MATFDVAIDLVGGDRDSIGRIRFKSPLFLRAVDQAKIVDAGVSLSGFADTSTTARVELRKDEQGCAANDDGENEGTPKSFAGALEEGGHVQGSLWSVTVQRGDSSTLPYTYTPPVGHFGCPPLMYLSMASITGIAPFVCVVARAHSSFAPSIFRKLLMQALRGPVRRTGPKLGSDIRTHAPMTDTIVITIQIC